MKNEMLRMDDPIMINGRIRPINIEGILLSDGPLELINEMAKDGLLLSNGNASPQFRLADVAPWPGLSQGFVRYFLFGWPAHFAGTDMDKFKEFKRDIAASRYDGLASAVVIERNTKTIDGVTFSDYNLVGKPIVKVTEGGSK